MSLARALAVVAAWKPVRNITYLANATARGDRLGISRTRECSIRQAFIGAAANSQVVLMNSNPMGEITKTSRIEAMTAAGGIQNCGKAANCQAVCPKEIPLMTSLARSGRAATLHIFKQVFG